MYSAYLNKREPVNVVTLIFTRLKEALSIATGSVENNNVNIFGESFHHSRLTVAADSNIDNTI
jgi:hypothetical protein